MSALAESAVAAAIQEAEGAAEDHAEVVAAAAAGAVEAAYQVDRSYGDSVRRSVVRSIVGSGRLVSPDLERRLIEVAERLSTELPRGRATWRGAAMYRAARLLLRLEGMDLAGSLAYFTVLSFFPIVTLVIMVFAIFTDTDGIREKLTDTIVNYFPASNALLEEAVNHLLGGSLAVGLIALAGIVLSATGLLNALNRAVNRVFGIETRKPMGTIITQVGVGTIVVVLFMLSVGLSGLCQLAISFGGVLVESFGGTSTGLVLFSGVISVAVAAVLTGTIFTVVLFHLPNTRVEWRDAAVGGIIAVILFEAAKHLFFWFTNIASQRGAVYGPVASVAVLLMWAYIAGMIFLYGAALARSAGELRPKRLTRSSR